MTWLRGGPPVEKPHPEFGPAIGKDGHTCSLPGEWGGKGMTTDRAQRGSLWLCDTCLQVWRATNYGNNYTRWKPKD